MQPKSFFFFFFSFELSVNRLQFSYLFSPHIFVLWISSLSSSRSVAHSQTILQEHLKLSVQTMFLIPVAWYSTKNASHLQIFYNNNNNNKSLNISVSICLKNRWRNTKGGTCCQSVFVGTGRLFKAAAVAERVRCLPAEGDVRHRLRPRLAALCSRSTSHECFRNMSESHGFSLSKHFI